MFLLSPARLSGRRGQILLNPSGKSALAQQLRTREGAAIGEVFAFVSALYFRGKLAYATAFAQPPAGARWLGNGVLVITQNRGLVPAESRVTVEHLALFMETNIKASEAAFVEPLRRDADKLARTLGTCGRAVLLGSIATPKYIEPLARSLGDHLCFPTRLRGLGDMSRGALLLRCARERTELEYEPVP